MKYLKNIFNEQSHSGLSRRGRGENQYILIFGIPQENVAYNIVLTEVL